MVLQEQISALLDFLELNKELAFGHMSRTKEGRSLAKKLWIDCANTLNAIGPSKSSTGWRMFFNEYKSRVTKKIKLQKRHHSYKGGGPSKGMNLTPLEGRLYNLLGQDIGEPSSAVQHNPHSASLEGPDEGNESFSDTFHDHSTPVQRQTRSATRHSSAGDVGFVEVDDHAAKNVSEVKPKVEPEDKEHSEHYDNTEEAAQFLRLERQKLENSISIRNSLNSIAVEMKRLTDMIGELKDAIINKKK